MIFSRKSKEVPKTVFKNLVKFLGNLLHFPILLQEKFGQISIGFLAYSKPCKTLVKPWENPTSRLSPPKKTFREAPKAPKRSGEAAKSGGWGPVEGMVFGGSQSADIVGVYWLKTSDMRLLWAFKPQNMGGSY